MPELAERWSKLPRPNILTQIEKLGRATKEPVQKDYQWLCNAVHPSVGGMLTFAAPSLEHDTGTHAFQYVCAKPNHIESSSKQQCREQTVQQALASATTFAVRILEKTLDDALRIIDDVGLTTGAPRMANFEYWRNVIQGQPSSPCPCRSGKKVKDCHHRWTDQVPDVIDRF